MARGTPCGPEFDQNRMVDLDWRTAHNIDFEREKHLADRTFIFIGVLLKCPAHNEYGAKNNYDIFGFAYTTSHFYNGTD